MYRYIYNTHITLYRDIFYIDKSNLKIYVKYPFIGTLHINVM